MVLLLENFILPSLNNGTYGDLLKWEAPELGIFLIKWNHKSHTVWNEDDAAVFQEWDKLKGHYRPYDVKYICKSKHRFRAALRKAFEFEELAPVRLESGIYYKRFRIRNKSSNADERSLGEMGLSSHPEAKDMKHRKIRSIKRPYNQKKSIKRKKNVKLKSNENDKDIKKTFKPVTKFRWQKMCRRKKKFEKSKNLNEKSLKSKTCQKVKDKLKVSEDLGNNAFEFSSGISRNENVNGGSTSLLCAPKLSQYPQVKGSNCISENSCIVCVDHSSGRFQAKSSENAVTNHRRKNSWSNYSLESIKNVCADSICVEKNNEAVKSEENVTLSWETIAFFHNYCCSSVQKDEEPTRPIASSVSVKDEDTRSEEEKRAFMRSLNLRPEPQLSDSDEDLANEDLIEALKSLLRPKPRKKFKPSDSCNQVGLESGKVPDIN